MENTFVQEMKHDYEALTRRRPALWSKCYPKVYKGVDIEEYYSAKIVGYYLFRSTIRIEPPARYDSENSPEMLEAIWASKLSSYHVPIFWLSREITEALKLTTLPMTLDFVTMKLPFEAAVFMLPKGSLTYQNDSTDVIFVSYVRDEKGEKITSINPGTIGTITGRGSFTVFAGMTNAHILNWHNPTMKPLDITKLDELVQNSVSPPKSSPFQYNLNTDDKHFMAGVVHLVLNTIQLMQAKPDFISMGSMIKEVRSKNMPIKSYWSPNLIGSDYKIKRESQQSGGSHASPRGHWVRGYWRSQAYGESYSQRKDIWIEPFLRGMSG